MKTAHRLRVDHSAEYAELVSILTRPGPGGVVVLGGAGLGKTSLVQAALERTDIPGPALRLHCTPTLSGMPYGVLSPFLGTLDRVDNPVQVLRAVNHILEGEADGNVIPIILVEDAQFLDVESSFVLSLLVENAEVKLIAIGAGRIDGESTLFSLTESGLLSTLVVQPFDAAGVRFLAEELADGVLAAGAVEVIRAMTGGNPSFVKAFVQSCLDQGALVKDTGKQRLEDATGGLWVLARLAPEPDDLLIELVREMHALLTEGQQRILEFLSLGGPQPRELLVACGGAGYRHLVESGILSTDRDGQIQIHAEIHAMILRQIIAPGHSAELHAQWAEQCAQLGGNATPLQVLWALEVGASVPSEKVMDAVDAANNHLDYSLAWKLCAIAGISADSERGVLLEARTLLGIGRFYSARAMLMRLAERTGNPAIMQGALNLLYLALVHLGIEDGELESLKQLWQQRSQEPGNRRAFASARAEHERTNELLDLWRTVQSAWTVPLPAEDAERILANPELSAEGRTVALLILSDLHSVQGRTETALSMARKAMSELDKVPSLTAHYQLFVLFRIGWNLVFSGRYAEAEEFLAAHRGSTVRLLMHRHGTLYLVQGIGRLLQGQSEAARCALAEAISEFRLRDPSQLLPLALSLGDFAGRRIMQDLSSKEASSCLENAPDEALRSAIGVPKVGRVPLASRRLAQAISARTSAPAYLNLEAYPLLEREVLAGAAERLMGNRQVAHELSLRLFELSRTMEGQRSQFLARLAEPVGTSDALAAEALSREATDAAEYQVAAESMARAAMLYSAEGDTRRCGAMLRELMALVLEHQLIPDAYVSRALAMAELTGREDEIVELVRQGKSNAQIARALTVSQRTVEGHLYRVFSKLGISERSELMGLRLITGTSRGQNA